MNIPDCTNRKCPRSEMVIVHEHGPAQAIIAYTVMCRTCKLVQYYNTAEYDKYMAKVAIEEAAHKEESETDRKRRRFSVFFGVRGGASVATRRY